MEVMSIALGNGCPTTLPATVQTKLKILQGDALIHISLQHEKAPCFALEEVSSYTTNHYIAVAYDYLRLASQECWVLIVSHLAEQQWGSTMNKPLA